MAFNKFDPHRADDGDGMDPSGRRRAWMLKWGWWISVGYTAMGFGFIVYWVLT